MDYFKRVQRYTPTRFWINNVTRRQAKLAVDAGSLCCTQNPAYLSKVLKSADDGEYLSGIISKLIKTEPDDNAVVSELQRLAITGICEAFYPLYEKSGGRLGLVSIQADPFSENIETILGNADKALKLAKNFIIKIPATVNGIQAMGELMSNGVPVLATEVMSIDQVISVCELHENVTRSMKNPAPFWLAHINGIFDEHLADSAEKGAIDIPEDILRQGSLLLGRKIVSVIRERGWDVNYLAGGARGINHFTDWVGVTGGVTINWTGTADKLIALDPPVIDVFNAPSSYSAIDVLNEKIPEFKTAWTPGALNPADYENFGPVVRFRNSFEKGWTAAKEAVREARAQAEI